MRKQLFYLAAAVMLAGCAPDLAQEIAPTDPGTRGGGGAASATPETLTRSLENAVYNPVTDAWMIPQADPFTLENFQAAYDALATRKSVVTQSFSAAEAAEFVPARRLEPTHFALKIYPRNEDEQWQVESMEDVQVAYIPFDYVGVPQHETEKLALKKSAANIFTEKSPYTVTYDYSDVTDGDSTGPRTYQLPILYTVWPASKPLPTDLDYVVDYEVFLPPTGDVKTRAGASQLSAETMHALRREAVASALGISPGLMAASA
ncbi:MAG: hypothetical protein LBU97_01685, partial [Alistipes sp.]|nr:hypothetical protein [Alistipes sp.]